MPALIPLGIFLITGLMGIDYGRHVDEPVTLISAGRALSSDGVTYGFYNYPSMPVWLAAVAGGGELDELDFGGWRGPPKPGSPPVSTAHLRVRAVFLGVTSLAILWMYLLVLKWRSWPEALVAASILAFSWEVAYHARWIAPDTLLMQFGALTIACAVMGARTGSRGWFVGGAAAAGLAMSTKYPGGLLILPVMTAALSGARALPWRRLLLIAMIFLGAYLITTPATILDPAEFVRDVSYEIQHYATGHQGRTVARGAPSLLRNLQYMGLVQPSPHWPIAAIICLLVVAGVAASWRESRLLLAVVASFPVAYLLLLGAQQVFFARNLQVLAPFVALLSARGAADIFVKVRSSLKPLLVGVMAASLVANSLWLWHAAETIRDRDTGRATEELEEYLHAHPGTTFLLSRKVADELNEDVPNVSAAGGRAEVAVFYTSEAVLDGWPAVEPGRYLWFGPLELNFNYYPGGGADRILVMDYEEAVSLGWTSDVGIRR